MDYKVWGMRPGIETSKFFWRKRQNLMGPIVVIDLKELEALSHLLKDVGF